ncbi:hypothetical protein GCM10007908_25940 [Rhizobium albus]|nr:hypothetical protein GCM10007908_25940 [Rhizobium albus]
MASKMPVTSLAFMVACGCVVLSDGALAQDGVADALLDRMLNSVAIEDGTFSYERVDLDGERLTFSDVTVTPEGGQPVPIDTVIFDGVSRSAAGDFNVAQILIPTLQVSQTGGRVTVEDIMVSGVDLFADAGRRASYDQAMTGSVSVVMDGVPVYSAVSTTIEVTPALDGTVETSVEASGVEIDPALAGHPVVVRGLQAMGYDMLTGSMHVTSRWNEAAGTLTVPDLSLMLDEMGILTFDFDIAGLAETPWAMMRPTGGSDSDRVALAALADAMGSAVLSNGSIRFLDTGLTGRILAYTGSTQGLNAAEMTSVSRMMLPLAVARLGHPRLQAEILEVANAFLIEPDTFEIKAAPAQPVPVMQIAAAAMMFPQALPDLLNLSVSNFDLSDPLPSR